MELRDKYNIPILLDESLSFGVLGETGHGATEHWGLHVRRRLESIMCVSFTDTFFVSAF